MFNFYRSVAVFVVCQEGLTVSLNRKTAALFQCLHQHSPEAELGSSFVL